jgi:hypothetical protein
MISSLYNVVAMSGVFIIIYVMQKVENDRVGRVDPYIVHKFRRLAFTCTALALCYSVIDDWDRSLPVLLIVSAGVMNLAVNAVSLHMRNPPSSGSFMRNPTFRRSYFMSRLMRYLHIR